MSEDVMRNLVVVVEGVDTGERVRYACGERVLRGGEVCG